MFNNSGTEAKHGITLSLDGTAGVKGSSDGTECYAETQLRVDIFDVGPTNVVYIQGKIRNSPNWYEVATITGESNSVYDISSYDSVRYIVLIADGVGTLISSGFFFNNSSNSVTGNLLNGVTYDEIQVLYPNSTTEQYQYFLSNSLQTTVEVIYTDSTKALILNVRRI